MNAHSERRRLKAIILLSCLVVVELCFAADKKQIAEAVRAVDANLKTDAGKRYDAAIGEEFPSKYLSNLKQCKQTSPPTNSDPLDLFLKLNSEGKVQDVLVYPENPFNNCSRNALLGGQFSRPPHDDYWINIHLQPKK